MAHIAGAGNERQAKLPPGFHITSGSLLVGLIIDLDAGNGKLADKFAYTVDWQGEIDRGHDIGEEVVISMFTSVGSGTTIGSGTNVGRFTSIGANVTIGELCQIGRNVVIGDGVVIPDGTVVPNGTVLP